MKILYLDLTTGISGDMFMASLLDLGLSFQDLKEGLLSLELPPFQLKIGEEKKGGLLGKTFQVHSKGDLQEQTLSSILSLIKESKLPEEVKASSTKVFTCLGKAEAKIHQSPLEDVHFHEVGALDSIIDVIGVSLGLYLLEVQEVYSSPVPLGRGFTNSRHGPIPLPAPATALLLQGAPCYGTNLEFELVTPTGAALMAAFVKDYGPLPGMTIESIGMGAGQRDLPLPNLLRVFFGEKGEDRGERVLVFTTTIDDLSPELFPHLQERLFQEGALDVYVTPTLMKKGRPGFQVQVLLPREKQEHLAKVLFMESSTLGIRVKEEERICLERREDYVLVKGQRIQVKLGIYKGEIVNMSPEFRDCKEVAQKSGLPLKEVYQEAIRAYDGKRGV